MDEEEREERDRQRDGGETGSSEKIDKKRGEGERERGKGAVCMKREKLQRLRWTE